MSQLNMRLPPAKKAVFSKARGQRTTDATTLARIWLAEPGATAEGGLKPALSAPAAVPVLSLVPKLANS